MSGLWLYPLLFGVGLFAGMVDSVAGGGGLITIPAFLAMGLSPQDALGTNKLQACFGSGSATFHFARAKEVDLKSCGRGILFTALGAALGTLTVQLANPGFLKQLIPVLLIAIALYTLLTPKLGLEDAKPRLGSAAFHLLFGLGLGFYDGFFGPGVGSFWIIAYVSLLGFNMKKATANTKVMNFTSNLTSLLFFFIGGHVLVVKALAMAAGQLVGARIGVGLVLRRGARFVRPVFLAVAFAMALKLLVQAVGS